MEKLKNKIVESAIEAQIVVLEEQIKNIKLQRKTLKNSLKVRKALLLVRAAELSKLNEKPSRSKDFSVQYVAGMDIAVGGNSVGVNIMTVITKNPVVRVRVETTLNTFIAYVYDEKVPGVQSMSKQRVLNYLESAKSLGVSFELVVNGKHKENCGLAFFTINHIKTL